MVFQILLKEERLFEKVQKMKVLSPSSPNIIYTDHLVERKGVLSLKLRSYRPWPVGGPFLAFTIFMGWDDYGDS